MKFFPPQPPSNPVRSATTELAFHGADKLLSNSTSFAAIDDTRSHGCLATLTDSPESPPVPVGGVVHLQLECSGRAMIGEKSPACCFPGVGDEQGHRYPTQYCLAWRYHCVANPIRWCPGTRDSNRCTRVGIPSLVLHLEQQKPRPSPSSSPSHISSFRGNHAIEAAALTVTGPLSADKTEDPNFIFPSQIQELHISRSPIPPSSSFGSPPVLSSISPFHVLPFGKK